MKLTSIIDRIFIYNNVKIILLIAYPILALMLYLNWDNLYNIWSDYFMKINQRFEEPVSLLLEFCYFFYSFYCVIFLLYPLTLFDRKYENDDRVEIIFNKESRFKSIKNILFFIVSPILLLFGGLVFVRIWIIADIVVSIWSVIALFIFALMILCIPIL